VGNLNDAAALVVSLEALNYTKTAR